MNERHLMLRIKQLLTLSEASHCPRRKMAALLLDPNRNVVLADGYNGGPRDGGKLCGGDVCTRTVNNVQSGTRIEVGCHHAEMNVICNAAAAGVATEGTWMVVTGEPCRMCAKLIHHSGIVRVIIVDKGYSGYNGVDYLQRHGIAIQRMAGPEDPREADEG